MEPRAPEPAAAGLFQAGNTCPFCQESIVAGQLIVNCPSCGSIHHETCWAHKKGCSSYHCDRAVRMESLDRPADIVLTGEDVARAPAAPPRPRRTAGAEAAAPFLPPAPLRHSRLALAAAVVAGLSLVGIAGAIKASVPTVSVGIGLALLAVVLGVVSVLRINNPSKRLHGLPVASAATLLPIVLTVIYFAALASQLQQDTRLVRMNQKFFESMPTEEHLERMPQPVRNAMRANVVVRHGGFAEALSYGSGVILKLGGHVAFILTNKHVIGDAQSGEIEVVFYTGETGKADILWTGAEGVDLALLACPVIALEKYAPVRVAEETVGTGAEVFAVGNPMGLSWTYTQGTISGLRRMEGGPNGVELYQTQTPINSGNSGGGLYTREGVLIGVNTLTEDKQVAEGLSFAISTATLLEQLDAEQRQRWLSRPEAPAGKEAP